MSPTRSKLSLVLAFAILIAVTAAPGLAQSVPPQPGIGIRLVDAPKDRADDPRALIYIVDHVAPGTSLTRRVEISNGTPDAVRLDVYDAAARAQGGGFVIGDGRAENELTDWIEVAPPMLQLAPGERGRATVTVRVPAQASAGERYGAVVAELPARDPAAGISVGARVGIRVYLSVGPGGEPATDFEISTLTAKRLGSGEPAVAAQVRNTGGRAVDVIGELRLSEGPSGLQAGPFPVEVGATLEPGAEGDAMVVLDRDVPAGPWKARLTLRSGRVERQVEAVITFPTADGTSSEPVPVNEVTGTTGGRVALAIAVALLVLIAALAALALMRRRRARGTERSESGG